MPASWFDDGCDVPLGLPGGEIEEVFSRYLKPSVLIMGRAEDRLDGLRGKLTSLGWDVFTCEGPGHTPCPVLRGSQCPLRELVDAALVFVDGRTPAGALPRLTCAAQDSAPVVIALEGRLDPPSRQQEHVVVVGGLQRDEVFARALRDLSELEGASS